MISVITRTMRARVVSMRHQFSSSTKEGLYESVKEARPAPVQSREKAGKNTAVAAALLVFVSGVYYTAINKMKPENDELNAVIESENLSNK